MATILHIDASARQTRSLTRALGEEFNNRWLAVRPSDVFIHRDVGTTPPALISEAWIAAAFTDENQRTDEQNSLLSLSNTLIDELDQADIIVIATPMYNYSVPASLKAWIDQVIRVNKTFSFDLNRGDTPLEPIMSGKSLLLLTSVGEFGFGPGQSREHMNHLGPYLKTVSKYLGVSQTHELGIEYQEFGDTRHQQSIENAYHAIPQLIERLSKTI